MPTVIAYKCHASLRDLLVHFTLHNNTPHTQQPVGVYKCNHPRCLTFPFLQEGQTNYIFTATNERRKIIDELSCKSKNLIYLIQCNKCKCQYIGETKRQLNERFGEHRRSFLNHQQFNDPTPVSLHFNHAGHSIDDVILTPRELVPSNRDWRSSFNTQREHIICDIIC